MSEKVIKKILDLHYINHKTINGRLFAEKVYTQNGVAGSEWLDVTNWSKKKLLEWLGY